MRFKGFIGPAYTSKSLNVECQKCVNLYPEIIETGTGKEAEIAALISTPGMTKLLEVGLGPIRLVYVDPIDQVFVASGSSIYKIAYGGSSWSATLLGAINTSNGSIRAASNLLANGDSITVFVDGTDSYAYRYISSVESFGTYASFAYEQVDGATNVCFIDGYFVFNKPGTSQFYVSEWGTFSVDPLSFASAEGDPDNVVAIIENHRILWLLNERTTECFVNSGNADFPFERISGGFIEKGCVAPYSVAKIDGIVFWLGRDKSGHGIVYGAQGTSPQRVSTHAIETAIQGYGIDSVTTADAYTYSSGGHSFYVISFPEATWVFDLTTKLWHERAYYNAGTMERHRASYCAYVPQYGVHVLGDYDNAKVYQFSDSVYKDDTAPVIRIRSTPHVSSSLKMLFHKSLQIDMETGVGLTGTAQGTDPQIMLDWSDDGGHSWSNELTASIGKIGEKKVRAKFNRLGKSRDRVYRIKTSDPVAITLLGAELDVEGGNH